MTSLDATSLFRLDGETAVITGGGTGIGLATAKAFAASGARVVIVGRREDVLQSAITEIGHSASYVVHDISDLSALDHVATQLTSQFGSPGILVNNAGIHLKKGAVDTTEDEF